MSETPQAPDFARRHGWDRDYDIADDFDLPAYSGAATFQKLPLVTDRSELQARAIDVAIVGAPLDEGTTYRPGARFGPRAVRLAQGNTGSIRSLQLDVDPLDILNVADAGDAAIEPAWLERGHAMIYRKVRDVVSAGCVPAVIGGDHSITWPAASAVAELAWPKSVGVVHFDTHADTGDDLYSPMATHGRPMRRLIESGAVAGKNFVQVGLHGYWPPKRILDWMEEQEMHVHFMTEIEERGVEAVVHDAIGEALDGPELIYLSVDIDVLDPGLAPGTGFPEPGGMITRELLRAVRQVASSVELVGMDVVEVSPPYDHAEVTAMAAHRCILETLSALAVKKQSGAEVRPLAQGN